MIPELQYFATEKAKAPDIPMDPALVTRIRELQLPPGTLPLAKNRFPFVGLPSGSIERVVKRAFSEASRRGRLTDTIRYHAGIRTDQPTSYYVLEGHIDLTHADDDLNVGLIDLGFEPDNFAKIEPAQYLSHYTLKHLCSVGATAKEGLHEQIAHAAHAAAELIARKSEVDGYVETEGYSSRFIHDQPYRPLAQDALSAFPFTASSFTSEPISTLADDISGPRDPAKRAADIHVKIAGEDVIETERRSHGEHALVEALRNVGFYEIQSDAGNTILNAHFSTARHANVVFHELRAFILAYGGARGLVRETCTGLWRKRLTRDGISYLAEVPPHLRLVEQ